MIGESKSRSERNLCAHNTMAAIKILFDAEHMHRAALASRQTTRTTGQLCHDAFGIHAANQHMPVITITGNHLIIRGRGHIHAHNHSLLTNIEMAKATDQAHAIHLARFFFEAADQKHVAVCRKFFLAIESGWSIALACQTFGG